MAFVQHGEKVGKATSWLYRESGLSSVYNTGRDAWLIIISRTCRTFAFGAVGLIIALFFAELNFSDFQIGLFMTLTILGDVLLGLCLSLVADSFGRRRVLLIGGFLMIVAGASFLLFENYWVLLFAAVVGVVSATGSDMGPFRAVEESILSHLTTSDTRADVLSWYVTCAFVGASAGLVASGHIVDALKALPGWTLVRSYHAIFVIYIITGGLNMVFAMLMTSASEATESIEQAAKERQRLIKPVDSDEEHGGDERQYSSEPQQKNKAGSRFSTISPGTLSVMYKLWLLLILDALAESMVTYTLTNYYIDRKFDLSKSSLGNLMSLAFILGTVSTAFAGPCARHIGLLNTMVFTHLPSSIAVLLFPFPNSLALTAALLFIRTVLNNMDQAPRAAFIAAVVKPEERTAVMGITSTLRILASIMGPLITGGLAWHQNFWIAFVIGGSLRIVYDLGLWAMFFNIERKRERC